MPASRASASRPTSGTSLSRSRRTTSAAGATPSAALLAGVEGRGGGELLEQLALAVAQVLGTMILTVA